MESTDFACRKMSGITCWFFVCLLFFQKDGGHGAILYRIFSGLSLPG